MPLALWLLVVAQQDIIHISDTHVAAFAGVHPDLAQARATNANSHQRLDEFVATVNRLPKATVVHTGDAVDAVCFDSSSGPDVYGQIALLRRSLRPLKHKLHLALGNHDVECYRRDPQKPPTAIGDQSVAPLVRKLWRKRTYYSTRLANYRLIILDNGQAFESSGDTLKAAIRGRLKTGHRRTVPEQAIYTLPAGKRQDISRRSYSREADLVLQLLGPHLRT